MHCLICLMTGAGACDAVAEQKFAGAQAAVSPVQLQSEGIRAVS